MGPRVDVGPGRGFLIVELDSDEYDANYARMRMADEDERDRDREIKEEAQLKLMQKDWRADEMWRRHDGLRG